MTRMDWGFEKKNRGGTKETETDTFGLLSNVDFLHEAFSACLLPLLLTIFLLMIVAAFAVGFLAVFFSALRFSFSALRSALQRSFWPSAEPSLQRDPSFGYLPPSSPWTMEQVLPVEQSGLEPERTAGAEPLVQKSTPARNVDAPKPTVMSNAVVDKRTCSIEYKSLGVVR